MHDPRDWKTSLGGLIVSNHRCLLGSSQMDSIFLPMAQVFPSPFDHLLPSGKKQAEPLGITPKRLNLFLMCRHYLFSQAVASQVSSAQVSLTAVFGMGTGGPSLQSAPTSSTQTSLCSLQPTVKAHNAALCLLFPSNPLALGFDGSPIYFCPKEVVTRTRVELVFAA